MVAWPGVAGVKAPGVSDPPSSLRYLQRNPQDEVQKRFPKAECKSPRKNNANPVTGIGGALGPDMWLQSELTSASF
jgi:hypothetical protein